MLWTSLFNFSATPFSKLTFIFTLDLRISSKYKSFLFIVIFHKNLYNYQNSVQNIIML